MHGKNVLTGLAFASVGGLLLILAAFAAIACLFGCSGGLAVAMANDGAIGAFGALFLIIGLVLLNRLR